MVVSNLRTLAMILSLRTHLQESKRGTELPMIGASQPPTDQTQIARSIARGRCSIELTGLSEVATYYAVAALFYPFVLNSTEQRIQLHLDLAGIGKVQHSMGSQSLAFSNTRKNAWFLPRPEREFARCTCRRRTRG